MIARKSRGDMGICCGEVDDEPAKSAEDGELEAIGAGGSDEAGFVGRGAVGIGTGGGESGTGTLPPPLAGTAWDGCSFGVRSLARSSSTASGGRR